MTIKFLKTDHAMALAKALVEVVAPALRPEEQAEVHRIYMQAITAMLGHYEEQVGRLVRRVSPSKN